MRVIDFEVLLTAATTFGAGLAASFCSHAAVGMILIAVDVLIAVAPTVRFRRHQGRTGSPPLALE